MPLVIPYFIRHRGCPHHCLFCNQWAISGEGDDDEKLADELGRTIRRWLSYPRKKDQTQLAFFGGSFTCLDERTQKRLLDEAAPFVRQGSVDSIRLSTRPDCLSGEVCQFLWSYGVRTVELGVQSMDDRVLMRAERGHSAEDSRRSAALLKGHGFETGIQVMPGLPGETTAGFLRGVRELITLKPDFARIYPTLAIRGTELARLYRAASWKPLSLNRAVTLTRLARDLFLDGGVRVIRMGLQPTPNLENNIVAGPFHPAFGELVISRNWFRRVRRLMGRLRAGQNLIITISNRDYSAFVGPGKKNLKRLNLLFPEQRLALETDESLERGQMYHAIN